MRLRASFSVAFRGHQRGDSSIPSDRQQLLEFLNQLAYGKRAGGGKTHGHEVRMNWIRKVWNGASIGCRRRLPALGTTPWAAQVNPGGLIRPPFTSSAL